MTRRAVLIWSIWATFGAVRGASANAHTAAVRAFDLVVYGGTAGGVITAVRAARMGMAVALIEPSAHLGGMVTGGLSATDHGEKIVIGGDALEFYHRIGAKYGVPLFWYPEPKVDEQVLAEMLRAEKNVHVFLHELLRERDGVRKDGKDHSHVTELVMRDGSRFRGRIFVDASYEGDVMAQAGVSYTVGREPMSQYGESLAGVRPKDKNHQFDYKVSAVATSTRKLLPEVSDLPRGDIGEGDKRVQAYNFRLNLTREKANQILF